MVARKPNPASVTGPDPGMIDDDTTAYLGASLVDEEELAKLVTSGVLAEKQAAAPGKAVVPKPGDNRTRSDLWPVNASMSKWDRHWMSKWFYHSIPFEAGSDVAKSLQWRHRAIAPNKKPKVAVDGAMEARFALLRKAEAEARKDTVNDRDGEEEGEDEGEMEVAAETAADEPADDRTETCGYTPTPSPDHVETGVESNSFPLRRKDLEGAKALVLIAAAKVANGGSVKESSKKKGLVDVACVFSDDESSDETPTSPAGRSLGLSTAPGATTDTGEAGGSAAAGTSASADRVLQATVKLFGSLLRHTPASPPAIQKGKKVAVEASASDYSLAAPRFAPGDFETWADLIPFVEGVSHLVSPAGSPSQFTELNEFDEGYSAIKSLADWILVAVDGRYRSVSTVNITKIEKELVMLAMHISVRIIIFH
uniref:Uncharacterized protein n=1 Tax=Oryza sativa subsp. japonica TaxID=39947 RepID=Q2QUW5_ORYSJ|nr:hypothetical protein LOC_Os12g14860 [Oryza sativa Japonica Group]